MNIINRCPWAIRLGHLRTRCMLAEHDRSLHEGRGLAEFPEQRVEWNSGHRYAFMTEREDEYAWESDGDD